MIAESLGVGASKCSCSGKKRPSLGWVESGFFTKSHTTNIVSIEQDMQMCTGEHLITTTRCVLESFILGNLWCCVLLFHQKANFVEAELQATSERSSRNEQIKIIKKIVAEKTFVAQFSKPHDCGKRGEEKNTCTIQCSDQIDNLSVRRSRARQQTNAAIFLDIVLQNRTLDSELCSLCNAKQRRNPPSGKELWEWQILLSSYILIDIICQPFIANCFF